MASGSRLALALVTLALAAACESPTAPRQEAVGPSLATLAADALDRGDHAGAADLYRRALAASPDSLSLHYGLAVAASHLNLKDEAIREFRWVLERGAKGSAEVVAAHRWLAAAGVLPAQEASPTASEERRPEAASASLEGRMASAEPGQEGKPAYRRMVILYGLTDSPAKDERYQTRTDENGSFRFPRVAPGSYMVTDAVAGPRTWRLRIQLQPGQALTLDLTPANATKVRDDFPSSG